MLKNWGIACAILLGTVLSLFGLSFDGENCSNEGASLSFWLEEISMPRLTYTQFENIIAQKENARKAVEHLSWVNTNYAGSFLSVKLKEHSRAFRVYIPEHLRESSTSKLKSYGIPMDWGFSCL